MSTDPGKAPGPMLLVRAVAAWLILIGAEVVHGAIRVLLVEPYVGDLRSRQIGVLTGSLIVLGIAYVSVRRIRAESTRSRILVGVVWLLLTLLFEVGFGHFILGQPWERFASDYDILEGGLLPLGLLVMTLAPLVTARIRGLSSPDDDPRRGMVSRGEVN